LNDAVLMQGYLHAYEHLFEMDLSRRTAYGQQSSLYGESTLSKDKFACALNIKHSATADFAASSGKEKQILTAYKNGVNLYISQMRLWSYPIEYWLLLGVRLVLEKTTVIPLWEEVDTLALMRLQAFEYSHGWNTELTKWLLANDAFGALLPEDPTPHEQRLDDGTGGSVKHFNTHGGSMWLLRTKYGSILSSDTFQKVTIPC
jgi:acyl-homoserine lactone acylase PvdQ